jgi:hypothetical protein
MCQRWKSNELFYSGHTDTNAHYSFFDLILVIDILTLFKT